MDNKNRFDLTKRELEIISALARGLSNKELARECRIAEEIVSTMLTSIIDKCGLRSRAELVAFGKELKNERERLTRALHDSAVQALLTAAIHVDALRRQAAVQSDPLADDLGRLEGMLREEALKLCESLNRPPELERERLARELHDSPVTTLIVTEIYLDKLRRQLAAQSSPLAADLARLQALLREEVLKIQELMRQPVDVDSSTFIQYLRNLVERFERETGFNASFVSELDEVQMMPPRVCAELARIVQEGLVLVRGHSMTRRVLVQLAVTDSRWQLTIEDDGRLYKDSLVIQERVRLLEGELTVSTSSKGSRVVVTVPKDKA